MADRDAFKRLFHNARREAIIVLIVWACALVWTVSYCYLHGYEHSPDDWVVRQGLAKAGPVHLHSFLGIPEWVMHGILLPWLLCTVFTVIFGLFIVKDDDLGAEAEEGGSHGH